jgi:hypothetical protein
VDAHGHQRKNPNLFLSDGFLKNILRDFSIFQKIQNDFPFLKLHHRLLKMIGRAFLK